MIPTISTGNKVKRKSIDRLEDKTQELQSCNSLLTSTSNLKYATTSTMLNPLFLIEHSQDKNVRKQKF